ADQDSARPTAAEIDIFPILRIGADFFFQPFTRRSIFQSRDHLVRAAFERPRRQTRAQRSASRDIRIYVGGDLQTLSPRGRDALKHLGHAAPILFVSSLEMPNLGRNV